MLEVMAIVDSQGDAGDDSCGANNAVMNAAPADEHLPLAHVYSHRFLLHILPRLLDLRLCFEFSIRREWITASGQLTRHKRLTNTAAITKTASHVPLANDRCPSSTLVSPEPNLVMVRWAMNQN